MKVALLYNIKEKGKKYALGKPKDYLYELDSWKTVLSYKKALVEHGHHVTLIEGTPNLAAILKSNGFDICMNCCEGYQGESREAHVPAILEMMGVPYVGSKVFTLALTLNKGMSKVVADYFDILTPKFQMFVRGDEELDKKLKFPLFVKPQSEGTGIGITSDSIVKNKEALLKRVKSIITKYRQPALVEEYIDGVDLTVGLIGNMPKPFVLPISKVSENLFRKTGIPVYGSELKVDLADEYEYECPAKISRGLANKLIKNSIKVMDVMGILDFCRVDFRVDKHGKVYFLEVNALPGITPISDLTLMAQAAGWDHAKLVNEILLAGATRLGLVKPK